MSDSPTWYDLLDVPRDASADEVREAWKAQIADLEPGDRRFDALNRAAKVLLDPAARAAYDAEHPQVDDEVASEHPPLVEEGHQARHETDDEEPGPKTGLRPSSTGGGVPSWLLAGLAIVAAVLVAATIWMWTAREDGGDESAARDAQVAAERAVVPILSYDYRHLDEDKQAAQALMTGNYREKYDQLFTVMEDNAPRTQTTVTVSVLASALVRATDERVQVLLFVDRPTSNKLDAEPYVSRDQVTLSMQLVEGEWLVDDMTSGPVQG